VKALVTGATGFIGSHLVEHLVRQGDQVRCLVRSTSRIDWLRKLDVEIIIGDFFRLETLKEALQDIAAIYHAAGVTKARDKRDYWKGNVDATRRFLEATVRFGHSVKRFVHVSSQAAVGPSINNSPVDETSPLNPVDVYGRSKKEAEKVCREFLDKLPITIIRPVAVYGPRDRDTFSFFKLVHYGLLPIVGSEEKRVALIHVHDLVEGVVLAATNERAIGETYFLGNDTCPTWKDLFSIATQIAGKNVKKWVIPNFSIYVVAAVAEPLSYITGEPAVFSFEKAKELAQQDWSCDVSKSKRDLGFSARIPLLEGMKETLEWYRKERWLK